MQTQCVDQSRWSTAISRVSDLRPTIKLTIAEIKKAWKNYCHGLFDRRALCDLDDHLLRDIGIEGIKTSRSEDHNLRQKFTHPYL